MDREETAQQDIQHDSDGVGDPNNAEALQQVSSSAVEGSSLDAPDSGPMQYEEEVNQEAAYGVDPENLAAGQVEKDDETSREHSAAIMPNEATAPPDAQGEFPVESMPCSGEEVPQQTHDATAELSTADEYLEENGLKSAIAPAALTAQSATGQQQAAIVLSNIDYQEKLTAKAEQEAPVTSTPAAADAATPISFEQTTAHAATTVNRPSSAQSEPPVQQLHVSCPPAVVAQVVSTDEAAAGKLTETSPATKPHKETAVERLTAPTAMRMLKTLQQTQGNKAEWHIATGVVFKSKKLNSDEMSAMVDRLCVAKHADDNLPPKLHAVKLVYVDNKETYEPVKEVTQEENISYMSELYSRCQETRSKTQQQLADKYLQPLIKPRERTCSSPDKA